MDLTKQTLYMHNIHMNYYNALKYYLKISFMNLI